MNEAKNPKELTRCTESNALPW